MTTAGAGGAAAGDGVVAAGDASGWPAHGRGGAAGGVHAGAPATSVIASARAKILPH